MSGLAVRRLARWRAASPVEGRGVWGKARWRRGQVRGDGAQHHCWGALRCSVHNAGAVLSESTCFDHCLMWRQCMPRPSRGCMRLTDCLLQLLTWVGQMVAQCSKPNPESGLHPTCTSVPAPLVPPHLLVPLHLPLRTQATHTTDCCCCCQPLPHPHRRTPRHHDQRWRQCCRLHRRC